MKCLVKAVLSCALVLIMCPASARAQSPIYNPAAADIAALEASLTAQSTFLRTDVPVGGPGVTLVVVPSTQQIVVTYHGTNLTLNRTFGPADAMVFKTSDYAQDASG